ncbi:signal peptidase I [Nitriliruptoraceae bacterium ZYF776]|nr:signal peptidase I [Profundirhabdus halotolerans]
MTATTTDTRAPGWPVVVARAAAQLYLTVVALLAIAAVAPSVVGWSPLAVISGSMEPAIRTGSVAVVAPPEADEYYATPSVIAFHDLTGADRVVTHRVVETERDADGEVVYTTHGDANADPDSTPVPHDAVIGAVRMVVPFIGLPAVWFHTGQWLPMLAALAVTIAAVTALARAPVQP